MWNPELMVEFRMHLNPHPEETILMPIRQITYLRPHMHQLVTPQAVFQVWHEDWQKVEKAFRKAFVEFRESISDNPPISLDEMRKAAKPAAPAKDSGFAIG